MSDSSSIDKNDFVAVYNQRDLILYAISVGFGGASSSFSKNKNKNNNNQRRKGNNNDDELRFVYERHQEFTAVPTFCLALTFWATTESALLRSQVGSHQTKEQKHSINSNGSSYEIPPFPPISMSSTGIIPPSNLVLADEEEDDKNNDSRNVDISQQYPVLHMWQSIEWKCDLPIPKPRIQNDDDNNGNQIRTLLQKRILSIIPKSIGTFVTSETKILLLCQDDDDNGKHLCTLQSTFLVLGIPKKNVIPMIKKEDENDKSTTTSTRHIAKTKEKKKMRSSRRQAEAARTGSSKPPDYEFHFDIMPNQALLYRLASGDSNKIHVVGDEIMSKTLGLTSQNTASGCSKTTTTPILHGLCTFGVAARAILQYVGHDDGDDDDAVHSSFERLEGRFTKPVLLDDSLTVKLWETTSKNHDDVGSDDALAIRRQQSSPSSRRIRTRRRCSRRTISFVVVNKNGETVLDQGFVQLQRKKITTTPSKKPDTVSKL